MSSRLSNPAPQEDQIFAQDRKALEYNKARIAEGSPERAFNLTTGTIEDESGKTFRPSAITAAMEDRGHDKAEGFEQSDYLAQAKRDEQFATAGVDFLYGKEKKPLIATIPKEGSRAAQIQIWNMLHDPNNAYVRRKKLPTDAPVYIGLPTWPDHVPLAQNNGCTVQTISYLTENGDLDTNSITQAMRASTRSIFLFQLDPHNPTGKSIKSAMPDIAELAKKNKHTLVLDISFPGYGEGIEEDISPSTFLVHENITHYITTSFSKISDVSGKRAGLLGIVYGKNEGDSMEKDKADLRNMTRWKGGHPDSESADLIRRVFTNEQYLTSFVGEQSHMRASWNERVTLLQEGLPELTKELEGMGPFRTAGVFHKKRWAAAEEQGVFLAPIPDIQGNTIARMNIARIGSIQHIPKLIEKMKIILRA